MEAFQAWLRANSFWWNEDAIELGCSIDEEGAAHGHGSAPRVGVRARRRLDTGEVVVRVPAAGCLTCGNCTHSEAVADLQLSLG